MSTRRLLLPLCLLFVSCTSSPGTSDVGGAMSAATSAIPVVIPPTTNRSAPAQPPAAKAKETSCRNGADDDKDGLGDCEDPDCIDDLICHCSALSCGDSPRWEGQELCRREEGCFCAASGGCVPCRTEGDACTQAADCCGGLNLTCGQLTLGDGSKVQRCMRITRQICNIECKSEPALGTGRWATATGCKDGPVPPDAQDCATLKGECNLAPSEDRRVAKCWRS